MDGENESGRGRRRASARSTSGAGFSFEDLVAADQLTRMLADEPALPLSVPAYRLEFQLPADQSLIDDLRITARDGQGCFRRLSISCKANLQVTGKALPRTFVELAWRQWRRSDLFDRNLDKMALATRGRHQQFDPLWHDIKTWLSGDAPDIGLSRIKASKRHRSIFDSVALGEDETETAKLIGRLDVLAFDFQLTPSTMLDAAVARSRTVLREASRDQGRALWDALVKDAHDARIGGGSIALELLIARLRDRHPLKAYPATAAAWARLDAISAQQQATIQTRFHDGHHVARDTQALTTALNAHGRCLVSGEAGMGKSAWVKAGLDRAFPQARQLWLGPEEALQALNALGADGCPQPFDLSQLLALSEYADNILVLDSAERFSDDAATRLSELVRDLTERRRAGEQAWQVVVIAQGVAQDTHVRPLWNALGVQALSPPPLTDGEIRGILKRSPRLRAHAYDDALIGALGNIRTLAWLADVPADAAAARPSLALPDIADMLWVHWTSHDIDQHSLLIKLARREAEYERSFAVSTLAAEDRAALKAGRGRLPLVTTARNRVHFEHDLAADWARYQALKEMDDPQTWAALASRPLWLPALRLLGLYLLHQPDPALEDWDAAFAALQDPKDAAAADLLLDALFLDPRAEAFLNSRADRLLANNGALLVRLLRRFMHVASTPAGLQTDDAEISLYAESHDRMPILRHWPPMLRFLAAHHDQIAALGSPVVAKLCGEWLSRTPPSLDPGPVPGRREAAALALASARTEQAMSLAHGPVGRGRGDDNPLYAAALMAAPDLPEEVSAFALEMVGRQPLEARTAALVEAKTAQDRVRRAEAAKKATGRRPKVPPTLWSERALPPWPLGPTGQVDRSFRAVVIDPLTFTPLARATPEIAREVLLACIIEDRPREPHGNGLDDPLGLEYDHQNAPMIHWKSAFFPFLHHAPAEAVTAVLALTAFCTARWSESRARRGASRAVFRLRDRHGIDRDYVGDDEVLAWAQRRRHGNLQLYGALDALERWLVQRCDVGDDLTEFIERLLDESGSAAILGVLCSLAKHRPQLLEGSLAPLLTCPALFAADNIRKTNWRFDFDGFQWFRLGQALSNMARDWEFAPHRVIGLAEVVRDRRREGQGLAQALAGAQAFWPEASEERERLVRHLLLARLDPANWVEAVDEAGKTGWVFECPTELEARIAQFNKPAEEAGEPVTSAEVVNECQRALSLGPLTPEQIDGIFEVFQDPAQASAFGDDEIPVLQCALGGLLLAQGLTGLSTDDARIDQIAATLDRHSAQAMRATSGEPAAQLVLRWAGLGAIHARLARVGAGQTWEAILSRGLAAGDATVIAQTVQVTLPHRDTIPILWRGIVTLAILGSALGALMPNEHEPGDRERVRGWCGRLADLGLSTVGGAPPPNLVKTAQRVERLWRSRFRRQGQLELPAPWRTYRRRFAYGLQRQSLQALFQWALDRDATPPAEDLNHHRAALTEVWSFVDWSMRRPAVERANDDVDDSDEDIDRADDFARTVLQAVAARVRLLDLARARPLWEPILALGPAGEYTVEHFIDVFFLRAYDEIDAKPFVENWEAMLEFMFAPGWADGGRLYQAGELRRHILGLDAADAIGRAPDILAHVPRLSRFYEAFAQAHLARDGRALRDFARFLARKAGAALRPQALGWLNAVLQDATTLREGSGTALAELATAILTEDGARLKSDATFRAPLLALVGHLARIGVADALVLQDRVRRI